MTGLGTGLNVTRRFHGRDITVPFIYNADAGSLDALWRAEAKQRAKLARCKIAFIGTSIVVGNATGTGTNGHNGASPLNYPSKVKDRLRAVGRDARTDSMFGDHKILAAQLELFDTRFRLGTTNVGPTGTSAQNTLGGDRLRNNTNADTSFPGFLPTYAWRSVDWYDIALSGGPASALQLSIGGTYNAGTLSGETVLGASLSQSNGTTIFRKTNRDTGSAAAIQQFNSKRIAASTATVYWCGFDFYDPANPDIAIYNMGQAGASSDFLATAANPYNPMAAIGTVAPDCVFVDAVTNDVLNSGTAYATIQANLDAIIAACKAAGASVILMTSPPLNTAGATQQRQKDCVDLVIAKGFEKDCAVIDSNTILGGTWAISNSNGDQGDNNHPSAQGANKISAYPFQLLNAA